MCNAANHESHSSSPLVEPPNTRAELLRAIPRTQEDIIQVLIDIDHIRLQENPQIEADYIVKIGSLETALLETELAWRRAKRKLALAQQAINAGEPFIDADLEQALDLEFEDWKLRLQQSLEHLYEILDGRTTSRPLSPREARELKRLYRALVLRLHPDVNPSGSELDQHLYAIACNAYEQGDLDALRALATSLGITVADVTPKTDNLEEQTTSELSILLVTLEAQLAAHQSQLEALKAQNPYALKALLSNHAWVEARTRELKSKRDEYLDAAAECTQKLQALRG